MGTLMQEQKLIGTVEQLAPLGVSDFPKRIEAGNILMCPPTYFTIKDTKNPFMDGQVGNVNVELASRQWQILKQVFSDLGCEVKEVEPQAELEDMVFAANQVLPGLDENGKPFVLLGEMRHEARRKEVPWYRQWFLANGYKVITLADADGVAEGATLPRFEGQGDAVWHPSRKVLWGGYGSRTDFEAYELIASLLHVPIITLKLNDPRFYHLDTCFSALDEKTVMIYDGAFDDAGLKLIESMFEAVIKVSEAEALNFALNSVVVGKSVVIQKGSTKAVEALRANGFYPVEVDTGEFMKSGGSAFCLKMMIY